VTHSLTFHPRAVTPLKASVIALSSLRPITAFKLSFIVGGLRAVVYLAFDKKGRLDSFEIFLNYNHWRRRAQTSQFSCLFLDIRL
jgi:hypothetical protein